MAKVDKKSSAAKSAYLKSAEFRAAIKRRRELLTHSQSAGWEPPKDQRLHCKVTAWDVKPIYPRADKEKTGTPIGDNYILTFKIADESSKLNGREFRIYYGIMSPNKKTDPEKGSVPAGRLIGLFEQVLEDKDRGEAKNEENWGKLLDEIVKAGVVFEIEYRTRTWTGDDGQERTDRFVAVFGVSEAGEPSEDEDEDEDEGEEDEESEDEDEEEEEAPKKKKGKKKPAADEDEDEESEDEGEEEEDEESEESEEEEDEPDDTEDEEDEEPAPKKKKRKVSR